MSRRDYIGVNSRNEEKIREEFIIRLLRDKPSMTQLNRTLASVEQQIQNRDESKWLFDFDLDDDKLAAKFVPVANISFDKEDMQKMIQEELKKFQVENNLI